MIGGLALLGIGLFGVWVAVRALREQEISVVWSMLGGWGRLSSAHSRDESPVVFWCATAFYGAAGALLVVLGLVRLVSSRG